MKQRVATIITIAAMLIVGAAPVLAAPGDDPGAPEDPRGERGVSADHIGGPGDEGDSEVPGLPEWAKAYGKRIIETFGLPYGHLLQCDDDPDAFETCDEALQLVGVLDFPDEPGARVFWMTIGLHLVV